VKGLRMSKQLWNYLRSRVQVVTSDGKVIKGFVTDFIDEMDNDEQDEITILIDNPSPDEPTEISLFETEISTIQEVK
jgi:ywpF protein